MHHILWGGREGGLSGSGVVGEGQGGKWLSDDTEDI